MRLKSQIDVLSGRVYYTVAGVSLWFMGWGRSPTLHVKYMTHCQECNDQDFTIYTQSNITQTSYSPEYITPTQQIS